jgi:CheY-like chemotaxis protein
VILLDVEMPGKNGYEVCEQLKTDSKTKHIPIIFVSGNSSLRERLIGYEVGGDDYLVKPCEKELIKAKVDYICAQFESRKELDEQAHNAHKVAEDAIQSSAEIGRAIRFVEKSYALPSFDELAASIFKTMAELGLKTSMMLLSSQGSLFYSHNQLQISPLEQDLLELTKDKGRFYDFGCRTICNFRQVSLLIKNMPLDDPERYGRLKDTVPFVLGATDEKIRSLDTHDSLLKQAESLNNTTSAIRSTLDNISHSASKSQEKINDTMRLTMQDLDDMLPSMGLDDDQEKSIMGRLDRTFMETAANIEIGMELKDSLSGIVRLLTHLVSQQKNMISNAIATPEIIEISGGGGEELGDDVELF